jgi:hypothetical protein
MDFCQGLQNGTGMNVKPQASLAQLLIILKNRLTSNLNLKCNITQANVKYFHLIDYS